VHNAKTQSVFLRKKTPLMLLLLAATTLPTLENNLSDGTDVPHIPGTHKGCQRYTQRILWQPSFQLCTQSVY